MYEEKIRIHWFGGFTTRKFFGVVLLAFVGYIANKILMGVGFIVWLMMATAFIDGITTINLIERNVRRTVRFFCFIPVWSRLTGLRGHGELHLTFKPSWISRHNEYHFRDFTVLDLRVAPKQWIQIMQSDYSRNNFEPFVLQRARNLSKQLGVPLVLRVERVCGALQFMDDTAKNPPEELRRTLEQTSLRQL
jgi:hypothetical protein